MYPGKKLPNIRNVFNSEKNFRKFKKNSENQEKISELQKKFQESQKMTLDSEQNLETQQYEKCFRRKKTVDQQNSTILDFFFKLRKILMF